ncbi:LPXTG cell wall anchor domain-containing protein, partial [Corynebacterium bovis]
TAATGSTAAQPAARAELARTGVSDVAGAVALAALALVGGATLLVLRRRA